MLPESLIAASRELGNKMAELPFGEPVTHVYNPLSYAWNGWKSYLQKFAASKKRVLLIGMNPGPWGMAQTGVPFGEIEAVREWMGIEVDIGRPDIEHPKRKIEGFECTRSEVSGRRLWGLMRERFGTPDRFFADSFVTNYCPLSFMAESGRNVTPDRLSAAEREQLFALCDEFLATSIEMLGPRFVLGVGKFAESRARSAMKLLASREPDGYDPGRTVVASILHPSPASPAANRDWAGTAERQLIELGVWNRA